MKVFTVGLDEKAKGAEALPEKMDVEKVRETGGKRGWKMSERGCFERGRKHPEDKLTDSRLPPSLPLPSSSKQLLCRRRSRGHSR